MRQDVIALPRCEFDEDAALRSLFARQAKVSILACEMAKRLYEARSIWIGGHTLDWNDLTIGQKARYRNEVERLIKGEM